MKVLVVEDVLDIQMIIEACLNSSAQLIRAASKAEAVEKLNAHKIDLVLLDVSLPDGDGFNLCSEIKSIDSWANIPIFFLTGKVNTVDKVMAFNLGAEDYITKPFDPMELKARVEAKLRQIQKNLETSVTTHGPLRIDSTRQTVEVSVDGQWHALPMTFTEFKLMTYFAKHIDHVLSRNQIIEYVWGTGVHVIDRNVDSHVSSLRKKLTPHSRLIKSVHGLGYKFSVEGQAVRKSA